METQIVKALEAAGRLTTRELAVRLGANREQVYKRCKRLEKDGRLTSELVEIGEKSVYFFPMTKEVVTADNYEHIEHLNEAIAGTIRAHVLPQERDQLVAVLELQFERLAERMGGSSKGALEEFADELLIWSAVCQPPASSGTADAILVEDAPALPGRHEQKIQLGRLPSSG